MNYRNTCITAAAFVALVLCAIAVLFVGHVSGPHLLALLAGSGVVFGIIGQNYTWPATGAAVPTEKQVHFQSQILVTLTGDGALTSAVIVTNFHTSAAQLTAGFPLVDFEYLDTYSGETNKPHIIAKAADSVTVGFPADIGTLRVRINRPFPEIE